jgi:hypothetical protein
MIPAGSAAQPAVTVDDELSAERVDRSVPELTARCVQRSTFTS